VIISPSTTFSLSPKLIPEADGAAIIKEVSECWSMAWLYSGRFVLAMHR